MNFLKNLRSAMTSRTRKKSVRVLEDGFNMNDVSPDDEDDEMDTSEDTTEIQEVESMYNIKRGYSADLEDPKNVKILHSAVRIPWTDILSNTIAVHNHYIWKLFLLSSIYIYYLIKIYQICFIKKYGFVIIKIFAFISHLLFLLNYVFLATIFFWKKLHLLFDPPGKFKLIFDGLLVPPYHTLYLLLIDDYNVTSINTFLSMNTLFRLYYLEEYFREKTNNAGVKHWNYFVAKYILRLFGLTHTLACVLFFLACPLDCVKPRGWGYVVKTEEQTQVWYLYASFMALMSVSNSGFNDFLPTNLQERIVITITMCCGFVVTTLILIGAVSLDMVNKSFRLANMRIQLYAIKRYLLSIRMTQKETDLILNYYRLFWKKKKGVKTASAINLLPLPLQMEIAFDLNYYLLRTSMLFRNKPESFLRTLSLNMKHEFFQPGESIFNYNALKQKMICVASGIIEITSDEDFESPIISFGRGSVLGEAALILSLPSKTTVRAANYCELQVLYTVDFIKMIHLFPIIFLQLRDTIISRIKKSRQGQEKIQQDSKILTLNLYVSQRKKLSAIERLKKRLLGVPFEDTIPKNHLACDNYNYVPNVKKKKGSYVFLNGNFPWIFSPRSVFMKVWEIVVLLDVLSVGLTYPYFIAYHREFPNDFLVVVNFMELLYYIDLYIILTTAIEGKDYITKKFSEILKIHLGTLRFYVELLATIPFEFIFFEVSRQIHFTIKVNRLLKCFRICTFFDRIEKHVLTNNIIGIRLVKYFTYIVMVNYWFGILLYSTTCFSPSCTKDGWYRRHVESDRVWKLWSPCSTHPTLMATYFGLTVLSTLGFGDISAGNVLDYLIMTLGTVLGIFLFGYCTSELSATISYYIQMKINFQSAMFGVEKYLIENKMNVDIIKRVMRFLELQWYYNKGVYLWKTPLLHNAPSDIRTLVTFKEKREIISESPLFQYAEEGFVDSIAKGANIIVLPPGEKVCYSGNYSRHLYIIHEGFCREEIEPGSFVTLGPGDFFGTRNAIIGTPNISEISTITHVKFLLITHRLYFSATSLFPEERELIQRCIPKNYESVVEELLSSWKEHAEFMYHATSNKDVKSKMKCREWFSKAVRESFIFVPDYCERNGENYVRPFDELKFFNKVKYVLLPICILPQGWFLKVWTGVRFTSAVLIALLVPYRQIKVPYIAQLDGVMIILDVIAYLDLYLKFFIGYYGDKKQLIIHPCQTAKHYVKGTFALDFVACFPWELLVLCFDDSGSSNLLFYRVRLIKMLQAYRLPSFFAYLEKNIRMAGLHIQIIKFIPFTLICLNVCAATVVFSTCKYYHFENLKPGDVQETLGVPEHMGDKELREYTMLCHRDSWIDRSRFKEYYTPLSIYMLAFYWSTGNLVGIGFGDLTAQEVDNVVIVIFMMMCGTFFFGYVFAYIASYTSDIHSKFSTYQGMVAELKRYFQIETVSKKIRDMCLKNANYRWNRNGGIEPNQILSIVHPALHADAVSELYQNTLKGISFFEGVDANFIRILAMEVREQYYLRGTHIFIEDDVIDTIFIIHRGKVEIKFYHELYDEMVITLGVSAALGNIGNTLKSRMVSTAVAMTNCDILHLETRDFHKMINNYPNLKAKIENILARQRHKDFSMPLIITEEKSDSIPDLPSESSDEDAESIIAITSSENLATHKTQEHFYFGQDKTQTPTVVENEYRVVLFIFSPHKWFKMAILPESKVLYAFVILCVLGGYVDLLLVTYQFAFQDFHLWIISVMVAVDVIYIWNIFLQLHTAYMNRYSDYVTDCKKIKKRYFSWKKRRIIDFLANAPFPYLVFTLPLIFQVDTYLIFSFVKLFSLFRIVFLRRFFNSSITNLLVDRLLLNLFSICLWLSLAIHLFSCLWYLFACPIFFCNENSWVKIFYQRPRSQFEIYIICIYFITGVFTSTGFGDITPYRYEEIILLILLMLMVKFLIGIFIGISTNIVSLHSSFLTQYEAHIYELRDYLMNENVSGHLMQKMWNYVKQLWSKRNGRQMPALVTDYMSYTNKSIIKYSIYGEVLGKSYLFHDLQDSFLRQLSNFINPFVFFPGNYIVQHGDSDQSMYLVHRGEVDVLTVHKNLTETIHDILHSGEMFGLAQGLFYGIPHHFSYRAKTTVDIGIIRLQEWEDILQYFPGAKELIYKRVAAMYSIL